jgi:hypothetical protein
MTTPPAMATAVGDVIVVGVVVANVTPPTGDGVVNNGDVVVSGVVVAVIGCVGVNPMIVDGTCVIVLGSGATTVGGSAATGAVIGAIGVLTDAIVCCVPAVLTMTVFPVVVVAAIAALLVVNCCATGKEVNEGPVNVSPITPIPRSELMNTNPLKEPWSTRKQLRHESGKLLPAEKSYGPYGDRKSLLIVERQRNRRRLRIRVRHGYSGIDCCAGIHTGKNRSESHKWTRQNARPEKVSADLLAEDFRNTKARTASLQWSDDCKAGLNLADRRNVLRQRQLAGEK